jgi:predicted lipoprotein with Yx(FWY)xxD motif
MGGRAAVVLVLSAGLARTACGEDVITDPPTGSTTAEQTSPPPTDTSAPGTATVAPEGTVITVRDSDYGRMLFDDRGQAIYLFDRETSSSPACFGDCAEYWPPVLTDGAPRPGGGADGSLLGTTQRDDGSTQVTYGGHPLYFYAHEDPGEVLCHDVDDYGGTWLVVTPAGDAAPA